MEAAVVEAFEGEHPDVIIVEGQGALSHPAYLTSTVHPPRQPSPAGVVLQHAPARRRLGDFPDVPMPTPRREINLIETFADTKVIGLTINHENMTDAEVTAAITATKPSSESRPRTRSRARRTASSTWCSARSRTSRAEPATRHGERAADRDPPRAHRPQRRGAGPAHGGSRGVSVTGVTKATLGLPELGRVFLAAGAARSAIHGSRTSNACGAGGIDARSC